MKTFNAQLTLVFLAFAFVVALQLPSKAEQAKSDEISEFGDRLATCSHWGGEPRWNRERAMQIDEVWASSKCDEVGCDYLEMKKKYKGQPENLKKIKETVIEVIGDERDMYSCTQKTKK